MSKGLENNQKCFRKDNGFLRQIYIKVTLPSAQSYATLNYAAHAISMAFLIMVFTCRPKSLLQKSSWVRFYFKKTHRQGVRIKVSLVENVEHLVRGRGASSRHSRASL